MDDHIILRQAVVGDVAAVTALDFEVFGDGCYPAVFFRQAVDVFGSFFRLAELPSHGPVGYALASAQINAKEAWILSMAVAEKIRGQGMGRRLLEDTLRVLRDARVATALLTVKPSNVAARRLYTSFGFIELRNDPTYFGHGQGRIIMGANLQAL